MKRRSLIPGMVSLVLLGLGLPTPAQSAKRSAPKKSAPKKSAPKKSAPKATAKKVAKKNAAKAGLTAEAVRRFIARKEKNSATGVGSMPQSATVTFESIRFGAVRKATQRDRLINGIQGDTVYPVRVRYISHRKWGNRETEDKEIHYDYEFFRDSFGEWDAYLVGPVR